MLKIQKENLHFSPIFPIGRHAFGDFFYIQITLTCPSGALPKGLDDSSEFSTLKSLEYIRDKQESGDNKWTALNDWKSNIEGGALSYGGG